MSNAVLKPLFKYPGGKSSELKHLKKLLPDFDTYIEPFLGGGAVFWATKAKQWIINDCSEELVLVYLYSQQQDALFINYIKDIGQIWQLKNSYKLDIVQLLPVDSNTDQFAFVEKIAHELLDSVSSLPSDKKQLALSLAKGIEQKKKSLAKIAKTVEISNWDDNALGAVGAGIYTYIRYLYNRTNVEESPQLKAALYLFLREYAYSSMFRYNFSGDFNVPFGGNTYAKKDFLDRVRQITNDAVVKKLQDTSILQGDFTDAFIDEDSAFMFLDPPYDSDFSTYNLQVFDAKEQIRLRDSLKKIKKTKWLMIVKSTDFIEDLYVQDRWYKSRFDKSYSVNFKNRNDKEVKHLIITNYQLGLV
jgi:DNA adenine methylase